MNDDLQQLKVVLQLLALPVTGQVRLVGDGCPGVEVLTTAFDAPYNAVQRKGASELMPEQVRTLARLDDQLSRLDRESSFLLCSEAALRKSSDWRQVRRTAREALVRFKWRLEVPPVDETLGARPVVQP